MTRSIEPAKNSVTYTYNVKDQSKENMLVYIVRMQKAGSVVSRALILTEPEDGKDWPGETKEIDEIPEENEFAKAYRDVPITCITVLLEYKGEAFVLDYRPEDQLISIHLPNDFHALIEDLERDVIPDEIDLNYDDKA